MTALPAPFGPAGQDDAAARDALHNRLDEWNTAQLRLALQAVIPALTPGQVFGFAAVLGLCDRWAGDLAGRVPDQAPDGDGGSSPELGGGATGSPQEPDREPARGCYHGDACSGTGPDCAPQEPDSGADRASEALAFLAARRYHPRLARCTGRSSDALAWWAVGHGPKPTEDVYPSDPADLAACQRTYAMAPGWAQKRMKPVMDRYRAAVARRYPGAR